MEMLMLYTAIVIVGISTLCTNNQVELDFYFWLSPYNDSFHHSNSAVFCIEIHSFPECGADCPRQMFRWLFQFFIRINLVS